LTLAAPAAAQLPGLSQAVPRSALVVGQVIDAASGAPVAGAVVDISVAPSVVPEAAPNQNPRLAAPSARVPPAPRVMTGADGRFVFRRLPKGTFVITAVKHAYLEGAFGRRRPGGASQTMVLVDGQKVGGLRIYMWRHAAISGVVTDEAGELVIGVQVRALLRTIVGGRRRFAFAGTLGWTDDRGVYRIHGLLPGEYLVAAVATQISVAASLAQETRRAGVPPPAVAEIGAATAAGGPSSMQVGDAVLTLGRSAIGPAPARDGRLFVYPTTFHPNTPNPLRATQVTVAAGEERGGVDLNLLPVPTRRVSGVLTSPDGQTSGLNVRLLAEDAEDTPLELEVATTVTSRNGSFVFPAIPVGLYSIRVMKGIPLAGGLSGTTTVIQTASGATVSSPDTIDPRLYVNPNAALWTSVPVAVGRDDMENVTLALQTGLRIAGRAEFEGAGQKPVMSRLSQVPVLVEPTGATSRMAPVTGRFDNSAQFSAAGLPGGKYLLRVGAAPPGWFLKSAIYNSRDVLDSPLDLDTTDALGVVFTFTDRVTEITGTVRSATGVGNTDATVIVFPSDSQAWSGSWLDPRRFRSTRVEATAAFKVSPLPAGDYWVVAIPDEVSRDWQDPAFLDALSRVASQVSLGEGEKKLLDLRVREVRP
jgi:hypothetical protein